MCGERCLDLRRLGRRAADDAGLSLLELIVVVMILGALIAIVVPVLAGVRTEAEQNALRASAAEGALAATVAIAAGDRDSVDEAVASAGSAGVSVVNVGSSTDLTAVCVRAENSTGAWSQAGSAPECAGDSWTPIEAGG